MTQIFKNNAAGRLSGTHSSAALVLNMVNSSVFPVPAIDEWFLATLYKLTAGIESDYEIVKVTGNDTALNELTVTRGQEGSVAKSYADGDYIDIRLTAGSMDELVKLRTKVINIGDWDMNFSVSGLQSISLAHGLIKSKIRSISALIREDSDTFSYDFSSSLGSSTQGFINVTSTNVTLSQTTVSQFDSIAYDSTSYNRGWIVFKYVD